MATTTAPKGRRPFVTAMKVMLYAGIVGLVGLIVAVGVAMASLPGYAQLTKRSDLGQMIRMRSSNGAVLVSLGPSFGQWLRCAERPRQTRAGAGARGGR